MQALVWTEALLPAIAVPSEQELGPWRFSYRLEVQRRRISAEL